MSQNESESRRSYINSPDWIENKKPTINSINKHDKSQSINMYQNRKKLGKNQKEYQKLNLF